MSLFFNILLSTHTKWQKNFLQKSTKKRWQKTDFFAPYKEWDIKYIHFVHNTNIINSVGSPVLKRKIGRGDDKKWKIITYFKIKKSFLSHWTSFKKQNENNLQKIYRKITFFFGVRKKFFLNEHTSYKSIILWITGFHFKKTNLNEKYTFLIKILKNIAKKTLSAVLKINTQTLRTRENMEQPPREKKKHSPFYYKKAKRIFSTVSWLKYMLTQNATFLYSLKVFFRLELRDKNKMYT